MDIDDLDFQGDVRPDHLALDVEWVEQPGLLMKYSKLQAQSDKTVDEIEQNLKVKRSQLILDCHNDPNLLGVDVKTTDKNIEAYYRTHSEHKQLKQDLIQAQYEANMLRNAVFAVQTKKVALQEMDRLLLAEYFSAPTTPRNLDVEVAVRRQKTQDQEASREKVRGRLGKSRRGRSRRTKR